MKLAAAVAGVALLFAAPSWAHTAPGAPAADTIDLARLALARDVFEAAGGRKQVEATLDAMYSGMFTRMAQSMPETERGPFQATQKIMQSEIGALIPDIIDITARVYARTYTEQELRDLLAFQRSPTGQAMIQKAPMIQREAMVEMVPLIMAAMPRVMRKTVDAVCEQEHCTPKMRKTMQAAADRAMQPAAAPARKPSAS